MTQEITDGAPEAVAAPEPRKKQLRIIGLDGIRGLGCLGVATAHVAHMYSAESSAALGINLIGIVLLLFFVLSGFLLYLPYVKALVRSSASTMPGTREYVAHRVLRVFPAYLVIFLVCNFVFRTVYVTNPALQPLGTDAGTGMITDPWQLIANLTLVQTYIPAYFQTGINPSWSLTLEIAFYATLPLLGVVMFRLRRRPNSRPLVIALLGPVVLLVIGFVGKLLVPVVAAAANVSDPLLREWGDNWLAVYLRSFLTLSDTFAYGMFVVVLYVAMERGAVPERLSRRVRTMAFIALFPAGIGALALVAIQHTWALSAVAFASAIFVIVVIAPLARGETSGIARLLDVAPAKFLGKISLSVYLWHFPVLILLGRWGWMAGDTTAGMFLNITVVTAVTIALSLVTYYCVEKPALALATRYRPRPRAHPLPDRAGLA